VNPNRNTASSNSSSASDASNNNTIDNTALAIVLTATSIVAAVVEYGKNKDVDLIVIGTRGRSGFKSYAWKHCLWSYNKCSMPCNGSKVNLMTCMQRTEL
jgi:hypothetical protein